MISALLQRRQSVPAAAAKRWRRERFAVRAAANTLCVQPYGCFACVRTCDVDGWHRSHREQLEGACEKSRKYITLTVRLRGSCQPS